MKMTILQKLALLATIKLDFTNVTIQKTAEGGNLIIFELAEPIGFVRGSQSVTIEGKPVPVNATDVTEVKVMEADLNEDFTWDDATDTGSYEGTDLVLDVAKRDGSAWLKPTTFAASGREFGNAARNDRFKEMFGGKATAAQAGKAKAAPAVVDTNS